MRTTFVQFSSKFCFGGCSGGSFGAPWIAFGPRSQKNQKKSLWGASFLIPFFTLFLTFQVTVFYMFSRPFSCLVLGEKNTYGPQFPVPLGTMFEIIWTNREKWKLRFRTRMDMKIKISRHVFSLFSCILWGCFLDISFSNPLWNFLSYFTFSCRHLDSIFDEILQSFWQWFSSTKKSKIFDCVVLAGRRHPGPILEEGGTRSPGPFRRHFYNKSSPFPHRMLKSSLLC